MICAFLVRPNFLIYIPLIFLESFNAPAAVLEIGKFKVKMPLDWKMLIGEQGQPEMHVLPITSLNDRGFDAFTFNPLSSSKPDFFKVLSHSDFIRYFTVVREGMDVDISIDSFPASDFGVLEGVVKFIGSDALPPNSSPEIRSFSFPVTVNLSDQFLNLKNGNSLPLQTGMTLTANFKLRKVSYLRLLLSNFKSKTDSLKKI